MLYISSSHTYRFIFPCFFHGRPSFLLAKVSKALIIIGLVSIGSITKSMLPFSAAIYGLANLSRNSFASFFLVVTASADCFKSLRCIIVIAASGPRTSYLRCRPGIVHISVEIFATHCYVSSAITLPIIHVTLGTVASQYANKSLLPCLIIPLCS